MEQFAFYLLKSAVWLIGFGLVYLVFLRKERFFRLKRLYLVMGLLLSMALPLVTFHYRAEVPATETGFATITAIPVSSVVTETTPAEKKQIGFTVIVTWLYIAGLVFFMLRSSRHIWSYFREIRGSGVDKHGRARLVRTEKYISSFSFFNYVFINPSLSEKEAREILNHELVHLKQKHWFDLMLVELFSLIQWMNPFVWIYSGLVRQNHENLADEEALLASSDPANYRAALLNQVFSARLICLSNSFNYSFNLNRFEMMKKIDVSPYRKLKTLLVLPVFAIVFYAFSTPEYNYTEPGAPEEITLPEPSAITQNLVKGVVYREDGKPFPGVSVNVSGSSLTVITDASGRFEFRGIPENVILVFSHKGYRYLPLNPLTDKEMTVKMVPDPDYPDPAAVSTDASGKQKPVPVVVVDGVITDQTATEAIEKMGDSFALVKSLRGKEATDKYGEKGAAGAIEIYSRKKATEMGLSAPLRRRNADDFPTFEGNSHLTFTNWVVSRTKYPPEAVTAGIEGRAHVRFTIETDGTVSNVKPLPGTNPVLGNAVAEVIKTSPQWTPPKNPAMNEPFTSEINAKFTLPDKIRTDEVFVVVETMPAFPGGDEALFKYIYENVKYPPEAREQGIQGKVILRFMVTDQGDVDDISVVRGVHPLLDAEAVRVMGSLPRWTPGTQGGRPVNVWYSVPIAFSLSSGEKKQE
jgi:TonB family protein